MVGQLRSVILIGLRYFLLGFLRLIDMLVDFSNLVVYLFLQLSLSLAQFLSKNDDQLGQTLYLSLIFLSLALQVFDVLI